VTSSGHVTSSRSWSIDRPWPLSYTLSIGTIPLSGFVSEIFIGKVAATIIKWWRHQWRHKARINYLWWKYRHTINRITVLKYRPIPTRIAGEEAFKKIMTSPLWHHPVTCRHRDHVQLVEDGHIPMRCPLEPSRYLASFLRYLAPKLRQRLLRDDVINGRHLGFGETGSRFIRSAVAENPTLGSNTKSIGRSVAEIWPSETLTLMTSLMTSQGPDQKSMKRSYFPQVGDHRVKKTAQSHKNWRRRSILKNLRTDKHTHPATEFHAVWI